MPTAGLLHNKIQRTLQCAFPFLGSGEGKEHERKRRFLQKCFTETSVYSLEFCKIYHTFLLIAVVTRFPSVHERNPGSPVLSR